MIKKLSFVLALSILTLTIPSHSFAQDFDFGDPDEGAEEEPPVDTPFDSGVCILLASGVIYGLKKEHDKRKATKLDAISQ